jgi:carbon-monoxide dehydrogenase small subunit
MESMIRFVLNDNPVQVKTTRDRTLLWVLRSEFGLTGTKYGCGEGFCGSCAVLINNVASRSCQTAIKDVAGKEVVTIEGLSRGGNLHPLQEIFIRHDALQCGYCTPGMILTATELLLENPDPTRTEIIQHMDNNLCRCGSYSRIIDAIMDAAQSLREEPAHEK